MPSNTITIESILKPQLTYCGVQASSKKKILQEISRLISEQHEDLDEHELFENLIARERLGSTGIGQGIAIPHSRTDHCTEVIGSLLTLGEKVSFEAIDNEPVDLLFVLIVPNEATSEHLELLSQIAAKFNDAKLCSRLRNATSNQDLYEAMVAA